MSSISIQPKNTEMSPYNTTLVYKYSYQSGHLVFLYVQFIHFCNRFLDIDKGVVNALVLEMLLISSNLTEASVHRGSDQSSAFTRTQAMGSTSTERHQVRLICINIEHPFDCFLCVSVTNVSDFFSFKGGGETAG